MELWSNRRPAGFLLGALPAKTAADDNAGALVPRNSKKAKEAKGERSFEAKMEWRLDEPEQADPVPESQTTGALADGGKKEEEYLGVFKARLDQNLRIGLVWEGRVKSLIFSLGTGVDLKKLGEPFKSLGLDVQFSS